MSEQPPCMLSSNHLPILTFQCDHFLFPQIPVPNVINVCCFFYCLPCVDFLCSQVDTKSFCISTFTSFLPCHKIFCFSFYVMSHLPHVNSMCHFLLFCSGCLIFVNFLQTFLKLTSPGGSVTSAKLDNNVDCAQSQYLRPLFPSC